MAPIGKARPRKGKYGVYTPAKTRKWEQKAAVFALAAIKERITGPVCVDIMAVLPRPKRLYRKKDPQGLVWAPVRPDVDNIRKIVLDSMKDCWTDDSLVVSGSSQKVYSEKNGLPRVEVWLDTCPQMMDFQTKKKPPPK